MKKIKTELHFLTESKLSLKQEERSTLVDFYTKFHVWIQTILDADLGNIDIEDISGFRDITLQIMRAKHDFQTAKGKMDIFVIDDNLTKLTAICVVAGIELERQLIVVMIELRHIHTLMALTLKMPDNEAKVAEYQTQSNQKLEAFKKYQAAKLAHYQEIIQHIANLKSMVHSRVRDLTVA